jgi:hypothetical protein
MKTIILLLFLLPCIASARIGETIAECRIRYGKEVKASSETRLWFKKGDFLVEIDFLDGKASMLMINRLKDENGLDLSITPRQIDALLKSNAGNSVWKKTSEKFGGKIDWITEDGKILAFSNEQYGTLIIITAEQKAANEKARDEKEAKEIGGF